MPGPAGAAAAARAAAQAAVRQGSKQATTSGIADKAGDQTAASLVTSGSQGIAGLFNTFMGSLAVDVNDLERDDAMKEVQGEKAEYGNGISTLILFANSTAHELTLVNEHSFHGRVNRSNWRPVVAAGHTETLLHVHSNAFAMGSSGCVVYRGKTPNGTVFDVFLGWDTPFSGTNYVYCEVQPEGHWEVGNSDKVSFQWMKDHKTCGVKKKSFSHKHMGCNVIATIGESSSPILQCEITYNPLNKTPVRITDIGADSITIDWDNVERADKVHLFVDNVTENASDGNFIISHTEELQVDQAHDPHTIGDLKPGSLCRFYIVAEDPYGASSISEQISAHTKSAPAAAPTP